MAHTAAIVTARNEADRLPATLAALALAFPDAAIIVADDGSTDATARVAADAGARVVGAGRAEGKGAAATRAARAMLAGAEPPEVVVLCDGDLGASAHRLGALVDEVASGRCDVAVAAFARRRGGGVGAAVGFARWAVRARVGLTLQAPISGQRALRREALAATLPFASGFGMEIGMTIDAVRAGFRLAEVQLDLEHRPTGRTPAGFAHRGRQLVDFVRVFRSRRGRSRHPT
jgi:glycosyltransferase involved in cell wall biosynthesis